MLSGAARSFMPAFQASGGIACPAEAQSGGLGSSVRNIDLKTADCIEPTLVLLVELAGDPQYTALTHRHRCLRALAYSNSPKLVSLDQAGANDPASSAA